MKKRLIVTMCVLALCVSIVGCGKNTETTEDTQETTESTEVTETADADETTEPAATADTTTEDTTVSSGETTTETSNEEALAKYVADAKTTPKYVHYIVQSTTTNIENGETIKTTDFVIIYKSLKTMVYEMVDDSTENSGRCTRRVGLIDNATYETILDNLTNPNCFEPLTENVDYVREISADGYNESYTIKNTDIIYNDANLLTATQNLIQYIDNTNKTQDTNYSAEEVSSSYGVYTDVYPYDPESTWSDSIDTWLEEYLYDCGIAANEAPNDATHSSEDATIEYD